MPVNSPLMLKNLANSRFFRTNWRSPELFLAYRLVMLRPDKVNHIFRRFSAVPTKTNIRVRLAAG
ncbi:MAG: hypothetical protein ACJAYF_000342 [Arenicella sp.]